ASRDPQDQEPLLQPWLAEWVNEDRFSETLFETQLYLAARGVDTDLLRRSFRHPEQFSSPAQLGILRAAPASALEQWFALLEHLPAPPEMIFHLVLECFFREPAEAATTAELLVFLDEVLPVLHEKYPGTDDPHRIADWCKLWLQHRRHTVPDLPEAHPYYTVDFLNVVKYVPPVVWWNNGLPYRNGAKAFSYYSEEFFWLATGGSLRKLPDHPPYSKRMAKEFLRLPRELNLGEADVYVYCWLRSLECDHAMALALQGHFHRPAEPDELAAWKARLDPVVQRLRTFGLPWEEHEHEALLGYLYHLLRDQPDFNISGRTLAQINGDMIDYYTRMEVRRAEQERLAAERAAARERDDARNRQYWDPLRGVQAWEEELGPYRPVRKRKIVELTNLSSITAESNSMQHCVSTYFDACKRGQASIWSLRELRQNGTWYSVLTIEVRPNIRSIVQVRGRFNATPAKPDLAVVTQWAEREGLQFLEY
ncbi:MAG: PcfJ domain-containing protein, partial [Bacteroidota bacterium]